jgi:hypothetical protein
MRLTNSPGLLNPEPRLLNLNRCTYFFSLMHQRASCVRMNSSPFDGTIDELLASPSEFTETSSNFGDALNTKQSPAWLIV